MHQRLLIALVFATGCVNAQFHSKTGQTYPSLTSRAVILEPTEARTLVAAGAMVIGTISSDGTTDKTSQDLADKAATIAAQNGGTHILLVDEGAITYTTTHPATVTEHCDDYSCTSTVTPRTTTTSSRPTAEFQVFRAEPSLWTRLPPTIRPGAPIPRS
jgi:hypothetical protein